MSAAPTNDAMIRRKGRRDLHPSEVKTGHTLQHKAIVKQESSPRSSFRNAAFEKLWRCKKRKGKPEEKSAIPELDGAEEPEGDPTL